MDLSAYEAACEAWQEAALGEISWQAALDLTEALFESTGVILHAIDRVDTTQTDLLLQSRLVPGEANDLYAKYAPHDVRRPYGLRAESGEVVVDEAIAPLAELDRSMVYAELYRPLDMGRCAAVRLEGGRNISLSPPSRVVMFNVLRANSAEPTDHIYRRCVLGVAKSVQRSLRTATMLERLQAESAAKSAGLDAAPFGVLYLTQSGTILDANSTARERLAQRDGMASAFGVLTILNAASGQALQSALRRIRDGSQYEVCSIQRNERRPLGVVVLPSRARTTENRVTIAPSRADAIVLVFDPDAKLPDSRVLWRATFHFTTAEVEIAQLIASGMTVREICELRQTSFETVRTQCKRIYAKLGVGGQTAAALVLARTGNAVLNAGRDPQTK